MNETPRLHPSHAPNAQGTQCVRCNVIVGEIAGRLKCLYGNEAADRPTLARVPRYHMWCNGTHGHVPTQDPKGAFVEAAAYDALAQQLQQAQEDVQALKQAIHPTADASWTPAMYVSLAEAHRVDSETIDESEIGDPLRHVQQLKEQLQQAQADRDYWKLKYHEK